MALLEQIKVLQARLSVFSSPGRSQGRAIVLLPVSALAAALAAASALAKC